MSCVLREGAALELRQLAAILLRSRVGDMWEALSHEEQTDLQQRLGDALVGDLANGSVKLRRLLALCVAAVVALSSTMMQFDSVVERILAAAANYQESPDPAAAAFEILEMLMESLAHDMRRHLEKVRDVTLAALEQAHAGVRANSVKLASSLLVQAVGERADPCFSADVEQRLHSILARAVDESDAATSDIVLEALTDVVPYSWGQEACLRTQHMLSLALNITARDGMPLAVRERASLFVVELAQCQSHVLREQRLFGAVVQSLLRQAWVTLTEQAASAPNIDALLCIARGEDTHQSDRLSQDRMVREKRGDVLMRDDDADEEEKRGCGTPRGAGDGTQRGEHGQASSAARVRAAGDQAPSAARNDVLLRALRLVLESDGYKPAMAAFARDLDTLRTKRIGGGAAETIGARYADNGGGASETIAALLLLRTLCEAARAAPVTHALRAVELNEWALAMLHDAVSHSDVSVRRVGLHCAEGVLKALDLDWTNQRLRALLKLLLDDAKAAVAHVSHTGHSAAGSGLGIGSDSGLGSGSGSGSGSGESWSDHDVSAVTHALAAMMSNVELEAAVNCLLPDLVTVFGLLMSDKAAGVGGRGRVHLAALQSLAAVATVARRRMPPAYLAAALDAIDPFLTGQAVSLEQGGGDEEDVSGRAVWVASIDCLAALAQAGVWDSDALQQHAVWMVSHLMLALTDADQDDSSVREAALAALRHVADALSDSFYPFLPVVRLHAHTHTHTHTHMHACTCLGDGVAWDCLCSVSTDCLCCAGGCVTYPP
jgi:predicted negative regulator of RcsB-dependent stress response